MRFECYLVNELKLLNKTDEYGKNIVYEQGEYSISVNNTKSPSYLAVWYEGKKVGGLYVGTINKKGKKWYNVESIDIDKKHRGEGLGKKLYQVLLAIKNDVAGIYSYLPNRSNKSQVPAIYRSLKAKVEDGDHQYITK